LGDSKVVVTVGGGGGGGGGGSWFDLYSLARETLLIAGRWSVEARREVGRLCTFTSCQFKTVMGHAAATYEFEFGLLLLVVFFHKVKV
jgi:hypothetical protein